MRITPWLVIGAVGAIVMFLLGEFLLIQGGLATAGIFLAILAIIFVVMLLMNGGFKDRSGPTDTDHSR